jgi:hypothetical protein
MKRVLFVAALLFVLSIGAFAQCSTLPCVVANVSLPHQTVAIAPTTLLTASTAGTFRVSYYLSTGAGINDSHDWAAFIRWTDDEGPRSVYTQVGKNSSSAPYANAIVHVVAGQPLEYRTAVLGGRDSNTPKVYDLYIVVEQIQ